MTDIFTGLALTGAAVSTAAWAVAAAKLRIENVKCRIENGERGRGNGERGRGNGERGMGNRERKRANSPFSILHSKFSIHTTAFVFFATIATLSAQKQGGGTNDPPRGGNVEWKMENVELRKISHLTKHEQIRHSQFSILNSQFPTNAVLAEKWWKRGAWEDVMRVVFPQGWVFPFGEDHLAFVDVVSQGSLRRRWTDTNEIASVGVPLALVPFSSAFWHEFTPSNSCRFVWSGALAERRTDAPVYASIELFRNGAVSVETNGISWRTERPWIYGETNAIMSRVEADSMIGGNGMFVFSVEFNSAPPETICLCVGTNRVAVSEACECCFVLEKGARHGVSLSYVPDGVSFRWWDEPSGFRSPPMRTGAFTERMEAFGSSGEIDFEDPSDDGAGSILWDCSLYIEPDRVDDPTYPMLLHAYMDVPPEEFPTVRWRSGDGAVSATGEWLTLDERPSSDVIGVTATWHGRTWRGSVVFWNDVEESVVALDGGGTIFVESAYTNAPGDVTLRTSTEQKLTAYWALRDDGTLTLSATAGAAVSVRMESPNGPEVELPHVWYGYAGDVDTTDFYVTNNDPSRAGEPVRFTLEFDGEDGDYDSDSSGLLEVVRYRVEADADWPSNKVRHVFGPQETFWVIIDDETEFEFTAPLTPGDSSVSFDYHGSSCSVPIRVIAPNGVAGRFKAYDYACSGSKIGAGFYADVQMQPTYVSFASGLRIMEDIAPMSDVRGCFTNSVLYPPAQFAHTEENGALNPLRILEGNIIEGDDHVRTQLDELPSINGSYSLLIPLKWGVDGGPYVHDAGYVPQTVNVHTDGTVIVSKFGITAGRKPGEDYENE